MAGRADRAGDEAVLADRAARDLDGLDVDLERVVGETPLVELQAAGLERVGLDDLGARVDHRRVHALDDVGPVEDERLVALAGEPAVVGGGEVELLERRAHPAVEHDDTLANGGKVVTRHSPQASRNSANLDTAVSRQERLPGQRTRARRIDGCGERLPATSRVATVNHAAPRATRVNRAW